MKNSTLEMEHNYALTVLYLKYRNFYRHGFQRYYVFRQMIKYVTGLKNQKEVRKIFQKCLDNDIFEKKNFRTQIQYKFNPYQKKDVTTIPNRFFW